MSTDARPVTRPSQTRPIKKRGASSPWLTLLLGRQWVQTTFIVFAFLLLASIAIPAWRHLCPPIATQGWHYQIHLDGLDRVSALLPDGQGGIFLSQEQQDGKGLILRAGPSGQYTKVQSGLSKPDGMVRYRGGVAFSQEQGLQAVLWLDGPNIHSLFQADSVEGLTSDGYYLYAVEDLHGTGRLLRYDPETTAVTTLRSGLDEAEGVASCPDGRLFYTEKSSGVVRQFQNAGKDSVAIRGLNEPGFLLCNREGLWVTEDATHMARVLLLDPGGHLNVVLSHLRAPQTIVETTPGRYLVAEQGRDRVLTLERNEGAAQLKNGGGIAQR